MGCEVNVIILELLMNLKKYELGSDISLIWLEGKKRKNQQQ